MDPKLEEIERHGEDCLPPLAAAKADQAKERAELTKASERLIQAESKLRTAEAPFADADKAAELFNKGSNTDALWKGHEAARREHFEAGAEVSESAFLPTVAGFAIEAQFVPALLEAIASAARLGVADSTKKAS